MQIKLTNRHEAQAYARANALKSKVLHLSTQMTAHLFNQLFVEYQIEGIFIVCLRYSHVLIKSSYFF